MDNTTFKNNGIEILETESKKLTLLVKLPDGCTEGRYEAAEAFARSFAEIAEKWPNKKFQYVPFNYRVFSEKTKDAVPNFASVLAYIGIET